MSTYRAGTISLVGRPNTGKSSLLNRIVGQKLCIVSPKAQTTRHLVTGILTTPDCQYVFVDSPGYQTRHKSGLNRMLNRRSSDAARDTSVVCFVVDATSYGTADRTALERIPLQQKTIAVVNKIDALKRKDALLPFVSKLAAEREFEAVVPVSARTGRNLPELLKVLREALPESPPLYPEDQLTDRDERFFAAELVREKLFLALGEELPYRCEVSIDSYKEEGALRRIEATIWVDRSSQKAIVIGDKGSTLKHIGSGARREIEQLVDGKVYLGLWVKVREGWNDDSRALRQFGYGD
jgi:GTP-binding protein Era